MKKETTRMMRTRIWLLVALHCVSRWNTVDSAIYVWHHADNDTHRLESQSSTWNNATDNDRVYLCHLHTHPHLCLEDSVEFDSDFGTNCVAVLIPTEEDDKDDNDDNDDCGREGKYIKAEEWLDRASLAVGPNLTRMLILAGPSTYIGDNTIPSVDDYNLSSSGSSSNNNNETIILMSVSYITGVVLLESAVGSTIRIDGKPPLPLDERPAWQTWQDLLNNPFDDDHPSPPTVPQPTVAKKNNENANGEIPTGLFLIFPTVIVALVLLFLCGPRVETWILRDIHASQAAATTTLGDNTDRKVLTESQVNQLMHASLDKDTSVEGPLKEEVSTIRRCAICIEDWDKMSSMGSASFIMTLPCQHKFHVHCIVPWLTERKAQCPLCNDDLLQRVNTAAAAPTNG